MAEGLVLVMSLNVTKDVSTVLMSMIEELLWTVGINRDSVK